MCCCNEAISLNNCAISVMPGVRVTNKRPVTRDQSLLKPGKVAYIANTLMSKVYLDMSTVHQAPHHVVP